MHEPESILSMPQLKQRQSLVALEALSVYRPLAGTVDKLCNYLNDVSNTIGLSLAGLRDYAMGSNSQVLAQDKHLLDKLPKSRYTDLMGLSLPCVPGQTVTWLELLEALKEPTSMAVNLNDNILIPYEKYVSLAIMNPERFSSVTNKAKVEIIDFSQIRDGFKAAVGGNRHVAIRKYKDLCARNTDLVQVVSQTRLIEDSLQKSNPRMVGDRISDLKQLTVQLSQNLNDSNQKYRLSAKTISNISESAYNIAEAVEIYATTMTFAWSHVQAFNDAEKKLYRAM